MRRPLHPGQVIGEVPAGFSNEVLSRVELGQSQIGGGPIRVNPQDLPAQRNCVVVKALIGIELGGLLVGSQGPHEVPRLELEVADAVVEAGVLDRLPAPRLGLLDSLEVHVNRAAPILALLVLPGRLFELVEVHVVPGKYGLSRQGARS
jgi:hypothetical protein